MVGLYAINGVDIGGLVSGGNANCFAFPRERSESGNHSSNLPAGLQFERSEYIGGLDEWFKSTVY